MATGQKAAACSNCGARITAGLAYSYNGKPVCYNCLKKIQSELKSVEGERDSFCQYLRGLFSLSEIPQNVLKQVDKEVAAGKGYQDLRFVIYYYYEVLGNKRGSIDSVIYVIRDQFNRAQQYKLQLEVTKEKNKGVDLSTPVVRTIVLSPEDLANPNKRKKKKYDISDL